VNGVVVPVEGVGVVSQYSGVVVLAVGLLIDGVPSVVVKGVSDMMILCDVSVPSVVVNDVSVAVDEVVKGWEVVDVWVEVLLGVVVHGVVLILVESPLVAVVVV